MIFFKKNKKKKKKERVVDLRRYYLKNQEKIKNLKEDLEEEKKNLKKQENVFSLFDSPKQNIVSDEDSFVNVAEIEERRKKLAKRLADMTIKIEELSNQIYKIEQRLELIERKLDINKSYD